VQVEVADLLLALRQAEQEEPEVVEMALQAKVLLEQQTLVVGAEALSVLAQTILVVLVGLVSLLCAILALSAAQEARSHLLAASLFTPLMHLEPTLLNLWLILQKF
jgi:phosphotransferase system  glucose/maltose/N-acetylglucosamine-specific IIC component